MASSSTVSLSTPSANSFATTASEQALEATSKLLSQSEYLQNMLDDVISKIQPVKPGTLTFRDSDKKEPPENHKGKAKNKKKGQIPPKEA